MSERSHGRLCAALLRHAAPAELRASGARPWASITFSGARHWLSLFVPGPAAAEMAQRLEAAEFDLPGLLVADLAITGTQRVTGGALLSVEVLTVEAG